MRVCVVSLDEGDASEILKAKPVTPDEPAASVADAERQADVQYDDPSRASASSLESSKALHGQLDLPKGAAAIVINGRVSVSQTTR